MAAPGSTHSEQLVAALRRVHAAEAPGVEPLARALLEVLRDATGSARVALVRGSADELALGVAPTAAHALVVRGEEDRALRLERDAAFAGDEASAAEALCDVVMLRLAHARAAREAGRAARRLALLECITRAGNETEEATAMAERAVRDVFAAFSAISVTMHLVRGDRLELVARTTGCDSPIREAPDWLRSMPVDGQSLQAAVVRDGAMRARPLDELAQRVRDVLSRAGVTHLVAAPLAANGGAVVGAISVAHAQAAAWDADQLAALREVGGRVAQELARLGRMEDEKRRSRDLALLNEIGSVLAQQSDVGAVYDTAVHQLAHAMDVPHVTLVLANREQTELASVACTNEAFRTLVAPLDKPGTAALAFRTRQPIVVDDAANDPRAHRGLAKAIGAHAVAAVPLIVRGEPIGVILLAETRGPRHFTTEEIGRATAVANLVAPIVASARTFDDLKRSYEALSRAQADLVTHERLAALGEFSAVIAHEVRNPLAIIYNSLGSLRRLAPASADAKLLLDIVGEEAARLNRIVHDLLDFVRPYASRPQSVHLETLVRSAVDGACRALPEKTTSIATDLCGVAPELVLDGTMIQQALLNLVVNALQATPAGGTVSVRATSDTRDGTAALSLHVADDGPGVDPADASRIFEPFFTTKATGTGLGLAVVRRIASALGGSVCVARGERGGAVFTLRVPVHEADAARAE